MFPKCGELLAHSWQQVFWVEMGSLAKYIWVALPDSPCPAVTHTGIPETLRRLGISLTSLNRPFSKLICTWNTLLVWAVYRHFAKLVFYSILGHGYSQTFYFIDEKVEGQRAWSPHPHPRERPQLLTTSLPFLLLSFPLLLSL